MSNKEILLILADETNTIYKNQSQSICEIQLKMLLYQIEKLTPWYNLI